MSLQIEHISYRINGCRILEDVTATAHGGEIVGLIGPNGAGKSTLANVLGGFTVPTSGYARLDDRNLIGISAQHVARLGVARAFQDQHLPWNSTVRACLFSVVTSDPKGHARDRGIDAANNKIEADPDAQAEAYLARFRLTEVGGTPVRELSFGQQRLLGIAMACARSSRLLILDEPFAGLKSIALEMVLDVLREEAQDKVVIAIDHTLSAVRAIASRIWFMNRGRLTVFRDYSDLAASEVFRNDYLGARRPLDALLTNSSSLKGDCQANHVAIPESGACEESKPVLTLNEVSAGYGNKIVIRQADLEVLPGEVLCVIGPNGSGKSTLLRAIVGVADLFEGQVRICGRQVNSEPSDARVRMGVRILVQDHRLFRTLTLQDNLLLAAVAVESQDNHFGRIPLTLKSETRRSVAVWQRKLEATFPDLAARAAGTYSGGEQSLVALAQMEFGEPKLVLLDEPTSGIDGVGVQYLTTTIHEWQRRRIPVVIVEHALDFVAAVATRVLVVAEGELHEVAEERRSSANELLNEILMRA